MLLFGSISFAIGCVTKNFSPLCAQSTLFLIPIHSSIKLMAFWTKFIYVERQNMCIFFFPFAQALFWPCPSLCPSHSKQVNALFLPHSTLVGWRSNRPRLVASFRVSVWPSLAWLIRTNPAQSGPGSGPTYLGLVAAGAPKCTVGQRLGPAQPPHSCPRLVRSFPSWSRSRWGIPVRPHLPPPAALLCPCRPKLLCPLSPPPLSPAAPAPLTGRNPMPL
jgi:hypothetical protein